MTNLFIWLKMTHNPQRDSSLGYSILRHQLGFKNVFRSFQQGKNLLSSSLPSGNRGSASSSSGSSSRLPSSELSPPPRQRVLSEPWLTIHNLACLNQAYEEGMSKRSPQDEEEDEEEEDSERDDEEGADVELHSQRRAEVQRRDDRYGGENYISCRGDFLQRVSQSVLSLTEMSSSQVTPTGPDPRSCVTAGGSPSDQRTQRRDSLPACLSPSSHLRRNTLPSVTVFPPLLHLPPLVNRSDSHLQVPTHRPPFKSRSMVFLPHPPSSSPPSSSSSSSSKASMRPASLPPLPLASSVTSLVAPPASSCSERSRRSPRRHSAQLEQIGGRLWDWEPSSLHDDDDDDVQSAAWIWAWSVVTWFSPGAQPLNSSCVKRFKDPNMTSVS